MKLSLFSLALPIAGLVSGIFASPVAPQAQTADITNLKPNDSQTIATWVVHFSSQTNKSVETIHTLDPKDTTKYHDTVGDVVVQLTDSILDAVNRVSDGTISAFGISPGLVGSVLQIVRNLIQIVTSVVKNSVGDGLVEKLLDALAKLVSAIGDTVAKTLPLLAFLKPVFDLVAGILKDLGDALHPL